MSQTKPLVEFRRTARSTFEVYCWDCHSLDLTWDWEFTPRTDEVAKARRAAKKVGRKHTLQTGHVVKVAKVRYYALMP